MFLFFEFTPGGPGVVVFEFTPRGAVVSFFLNSHPGVPVFSFEFTLGNVPR